MRPSGLPNGSSHPIRPSPITRPTSSASLRSNIQVLARRVRMYKLAAMLLASQILAVAQPAQSDKPAAPRSFEVASVKPNPSGALEQSGRSGNGSMTMTNMRVRALIVTAYGIRPDRIVGAPAWIDEDRFDVAARAPADTPDN